MSLFKTLLSVKVTRVISLSVILFSCIQLFCLQQQQFPGDQTEVKLASTRF